MSKFSSLLCYSDGKWVGDDPKENSHSKFKDKVKEWKKNGKGHTAVVKGIPGKEGK